MSLATGVRLGPYLIVSAIGAGGMGEVYRARDSRLDRDVAIKVLPDAFARDPDRLSRFEREAKAVAALSHPNILAIHDTGSHDGRVFVVTELLEGETLRARVEQGPMPVRKATETAVQIARGLAAAHDKGIIHRDLKPENVFLLGDGQVKILDFGLARAIDNGATETMPAATDPGAVLGTVGYMAPEQVRGQVVDARADLFAFGTVLYEMLSGRRAFKGDTAADTSIAIVKEDPPELSGVRADVPLALQRIVRHCLEKNPAERFQSARDVAFALESSSDSSPSTLNPTSSGGAVGAASASRPRTRAAIAVGTAIFLTFAVVAWKANSSRPAVSDTAAAPIVIGTASQLTTDEGLEIDPAISPDGKLLAYAAGTATKMRVFIRPVTGGRTIPLSESRDAYEYRPRWSPDGNQILYLTRAGAFVASALGGTSRQVIQGPIGGAAWSADGKQILIARGITLSVVPLDGGTERVLGTAPDVLHSCDWAARGDLIACVYGNAQFTVPGTTFGNTAPSTLVLMPAAGGQFVSLTQDKSLNQSPVWSTDGRQLYFVSNRQGPRDIYVLDFTADGRSQGEPRRVSTGLGAQSIAFSATTARLIYVAYSARSNVWSLPIPSSGTADSSSAVALTAGNQIVESVRVTKDRQWLLYDSSLQLNADVFRVPLAGGAAERLTTDPIDEFAPDLSPDGRELAYHSFQSGSRDIFVKRLDGGQPLQVTASPSQESYPIWSPDGGAIAFVDQALENGRLRGLFVVRRDASGQWGAPRLVRKAVAPRAAWLPDGQSFLGAEAGALEIISAETGAVRVVYTPTGSGDPAVESVALADDGRTAYFKNHDADGRAAFWAVPLAGGRPRLLARFNDLSRPSNRPDFSVGAGRLFFTLDDRQADIWMADVTRR